MGWGGGHLGALRGTLGQFGALWDTMGTLCEPMGTSGGTFGHNGIPVIQWGHFGMVWGTFGGTLGAKWDNLGHFGVLWDTFGPESGDTSGALRDTAGTLWDPVVPPGAPLRGCGGGASRGRTALHRPTPPHRSHRPYCAPPVRSSRFGGGVGGIGFRIGAGRGPLPPPPRTLGALWGYGAGSALGPQICFRGERWGWGGVVQLCGIGGEGEKGKSEEERENGGQKVGGDRGKKGKKGEKGVGDCRGCGAGTCGAPPSLTHGAKVAAALRKWPRSHSRPRSPQIRLHAGRGRAPLRSPIGTGLWGPHNSIGTGIGVSPKRWRFRDPASPREPDLRSSGAP